MEPLQFSTDKLYVGGRWMSGDRETAEVFSPTTGQVMAHVPLATVEDADAAVAAAVELHQQGAWSGRTFAERADVLDAIGDGILAREVEFNRAYTTDLGGLASVAPLVAKMSVGIFKHYAAIAREMDQAPELRTGSGSAVLIRRVPVGPVLGSVPWNGPLVLTAVKMGAALAAGCPVVIKVDPVAPLVSFLLAEVLDSLKLPEGLVSLLPAGLETSKHLVSHPDIRFVSFTGSTSVGREVMRAAAENLTPVTLELGGKSSAIVLDDVDPSEASMLLAGCLAQSGQVCTTYSRVLVPAARLQEWERCMSDLYAGLPIGDPADPENMIGPLASAQQLANVESWVSIAREDGGAVLTGGGRPDHLDEGFFYEPTLITEVRPEARIAQEEVFGPVTVLLPYDDLDDAVRLANGTDYALGAGIFTHDIARAEDLAPRLLAGAVSINNSGANLQEPFGGFGKSGFGRDGGREGIEALLHVTQMQYPASN